MIHARAVLVKNTKNAMVFKPDVIRIKAMCLISCEDKILLARGFYKDRNCLKILSIQYIVC